MTLDKFTEKIAKAIRLSGHYPIEEVAVIELYNALKHELDNDILHALKHLAYSSEKINIENILKHIAEKKGDRLLEEKIKHSKDDQLAVRKLKGTDMPPDAKEAIDKLHQKFKGGMG